MRYRHTVSFTYPENIHGHMISPEQVGKDKLDENFSYYDKSLRGFNRFFHFVFMILVFPITFIRYGVKRKGLWRLKKYKKQLKNGYFTTCNHIFEWDYLIVRSCFYTKRGYVTVWDKNHNGPLGPLMRKVGSIPIPDTHSSGMNKFLSDIKVAISEGQMIHFYPEGSMWYYYQDLREFLPGVFTLAVICDRPIVPLAISYRPAKGLYKLWKRHGYPTCTVEVGEPIFPDKSLPANERSKKMLEECYEATKSMMRNNTPIIK